MGLFIVKSIVIKCFLCEMKLLVPPSAYYDKAWPLYYAAKTDDHEGPYICSACFNLFEDICVEDYLLKEEKML